jgi:hypothetical protein
MFQGFEICSLKKNQVLKFLEINVSGFQGIQILMFRGLRLKKFQTS